MKKVLVAAAAATLLVLAGAADAASNKKKPAKHDSRSNYTSEERRKIHLAAMELCRKKYGRTSLHHVEVDYKRHRVRCWIY